MSKEHKRLMAGDLERAGWSTNGRRWWLNKHSGIPARKLADAWAIMRFTQAAVADALVEEKKRNDREIRRTPCDEAVHDRARCETCVYHDALADLILERGIKTEGVEHHV